MKKKTLKILGLNSGEINSSAILLENGNIVSGVQEERLNRQKFTKDFPSQSINYCLKKNNILLSNLDAIAQGWNPGAHMEKFNPLISKNRTYRENNLYTVSDNLFKFIERKTGDYIEVKFPPSSKMPRVFHVQHHRCHAANSFYLSNFKKAAILTVDFKGEHECTTLGIGNGNKITILEKQTMPNSLGMFYATYTSILGYKHDSDEWKVMAMSAYKMNCNEIIKKIKKTYKLLPDGKLELNQRYYTGNLNDQNTIYSKDLLKLLNIKKIIKGNHPTNLQKKIAKAMQICSEEIALHYLKRLYKLTKLSNIVLGGGYFLNSVFNGKILKKTSFKNSYIPYAPSDTGNSIGSALYTQHMIFKKPRKIINNTSLIGPSYSDKEIKLSLNRRNVKFKKINNIPNIVAKECAKGSVVAFFSGPMEFGDRALGCRSIIADPRLDKIKNKVNKQVKYRESYRPFAPSVIAEEASKYFEVTNNFLCRYMEKVVNVRKKFRKRLPAITHIDGTARLQTVTIKENPIFYNVLKEFKKITGFPVLLNTSLNINGEPLVMSPDDAITTFYNSGLDVLVLGNFVVKKQDMNN